MADRPTAFKKMVMLFGAGAVLDWGAPLTICGGDSLTFKPDHGSTEIRNRVCCLTHLMTATGYYSRDGQRVSKKIYDLLISRNNNPQKNITFETIIDFIEEIYDYFASKNTKGLSPNLYSFISIEELINDLFYFEIEDSTISNYSLKIPQFEYHEGKFIPIEIAPEQKYCQLLLKELIGGIIGHISKYSYHTEGNSKVLYNSTNEHLNMLFTKWCKNFVDSNYCLRMYTLNYDRIFKILLQDQNINVFEGFDLDKATIAYSDYLTPNLKKVVSDFDCHSFYNLHGSANWYFTSLNSNQLPGYQFYLTAGPELNNRTGIFEIERNRAILLSNIITGYKKVLKTAISPFRQFHSAFDRDCIESNELIIVGYSFGDEHINDIIRNARKYNPQMKITLIEPFFNDEKFMFDFILHWGAPKGMIYKKASANEIISQDYNVRIIQMTFAQFLEVQNRES